MIEIRETLTSSTLVLCLKSSVNSALPSVRMKHSTTSSPRQLQQLERVRGNPDGGVT